MVPAALGGFLQHLRKAMAAETLAAHSDRELIERFLISHDEAAFHALLRRHGPMVIRVCRRVLEQEQDVEDAFQATFLVLARQADLIRKRESVASWLHGVAYRLALNARKATQRRRKHEMRAPLCTCAAPLTDDVAWRELRSLFDEELVKLPERLRLPLVLCYLEGLTQDEAAQRLGQSQGTFRRNLERGRELLGGRLTRRGVTLSAALFAPLVSECAVSAAVPSALAASTTDAAAALVAGKAIRGLASARALKLAQGLVEPGLSAKVKCVCLLMLATVFAGLGGAALPKDTRPVESTPPPAARQQVATAAVMASPAIATVDEPKTTQRMEFRVPLLVLHAVVQTELKLTAEQLGRIRDLIHAVDAHAYEGNPRVQPLQLDERVERANKLIQEKHKALRKALPEILTEVQAVRLRQLERQAAGMSSFQDPENVKLLALTDEQRSKIRTIIAQAREFRPVVKDGNVLTFNNQEADKAAIQQILEMLTDHQRKTWRDLVGETMDVRSLRLVDLFAPPGRLPPVRARALSLPPPKFDPDGDHER
jgi:RNA polymerase sigma factor (sigma-70 family)